MRECELCKGRREMDCIQCYGSGRHGVYPNKPCAYCNGSKKQPCPECGGSGRKNQQLILSRISADYPIIDNHNYTDVFSGRRMEKKIDGNQIQSMPKLWKKAQRIFQRRLFPSL